MSNNSTDWQQFVDQFDQMTCIISVEKKPDGGYGTIRIVAGNQSYLDSLALAAGGVELGSNDKVEFRPNSEYTKYIPKDLNFEDACYRCAILKQPMHNLVRATRYPFDMNIFLMPLAHEDGNVAYCTHTQMLIPKNDDNLLAMNISRKMAADVISTCIKLRGDKPFNDIMNEVVEDIRKICGSDYCCVLLMDENLRMCTVLGQSSAPGSGLKRMEAYMGEDFYDLAETWMDTASGSYCLVISDSNDMEYLREKNPAWYESLVSADAHNLVLFPLISRGHFLGYIWATNFDVEDTLRIKDTLELTTYFIASEIASNQFIEQLKTLSKMDLLTGVMNRNEMNNRVAEIAALAEEPSDSFEPADHSSDPSSTDSTISKNATDSSANSINTSTLSEKNNSTDKTELSEKNTGLSRSRGIIFADMNGLKQVNDTQGHIAGDMLLKNAAMILRSTFDGDEIYRVGGDEFMVLMNSTTEEEMQQKIAEIKKKSEMFDNVSFAAGYCLLEKDSDIREMLAEADARMYEDKENYYRENGDRRCAPLTDRL